MKKSIVAMLSITALATVANADPFTAPTGTHFNTTTPGEPFFGFLDDGGSNTGPFYWFAATDVVYYCESKFGTYTNTADIGSYIGDRPEIATNYVGQYDCCLSIDTEGGRLYRRMAGDMEPANGVDTFPQYDVTSSLYFDSLVQFTVNEDEAPTIQNGDKLAVWLKGGETTNLVITAGYVSDSGTITPTNYVIDAVTVEPATWYRLTIEAFPLTAEGTEASNRYLGFRVRIDGNYLSTDQAKMGGTVGQCVGEMGGANVVEVSADEMLKLFPSLVVASSDDGNCGNLSCVAFEGTGAVDDLTFTPNDPFAGAAPAVPTVDGNESAGGDAFIAAATSGTVNILPTGWTLDGNIIKDGNNETYATIPAFYTATLTDGTLTLVLNTTALPTIGAADVTVGEETEAKEAIEVDATTFTATLTGTEAKLYYGLSVATTPNPANWPAPASLTKGTGSAMQLTADKPVDGSTVAPAAFFKVYVTDIAPAAPAPAGE